MPSLTRRFNVRIPLRDGITLSADVTLPAALPAPAVVSRTPYGKAGERQSTRATVFATAGYAAVFVDVRGRGDSDGQFQPYRNDGPDGDDVIGWVAAQDWCTGDVATHGASYGGRIQWLTALEHPPALRAMVCLVTPSDPFVETPTGVPSPMHINWFRLVDARMPQYIENVNWAEVYRHRPLMTMDEAAGFVSTELARRTGPPHPGPWWEPVRYQHRIGAVDVPVLHVSGWYDDEEIGTPANFAAMVAAGRDRQRLLMGPWGHAVNTHPHAGRGGLRPERAHRPRRGRRRVSRRARERDQPRQAAAPVRIFVMGAGEWRDEPSWPPPAGDRDHLVPVQRWFGQQPVRRRPLAASAPGGDQPPDSWVHDPDRPVPFITNASSAQIGGPDDYHGVQTRGDVLVYSGDPLTEPVEVIGPVRLIAHVATSALDTDITAKLVDVHPNGFAQRLCDGMLRLRYRSGFGREELLRPARCTRSASRYGIPACGCSQGTGCGWRSPRRPSPRST